MKRLTLPLPLEHGAISKRRTEILTALCAADAGFSSTPVSSIRSETLDRMLALYDKAFLCGLLSKELPMLRVTLSARLTSSAGKFLCTRGPFRRIKDAEIRMSSDFLLRLEKGPFTLNGLSACSAQEAFLIVFEHELCHALEILLYGQTSHSIRFLTLANGLFGHTATRHRLPTRRQEAARDGLFVGSRVTFSHQGKILSGTVTYIGKAVTVMVLSPAGEYRDSRSRRYAKYRISPSHLTIIQ